MKVIEVISKARDFVVKVDDFTLTAVSTHTSKNYSMSLPVGSTLRHRLMALDSVAIMRGMQHLFADTNEATTVTKAILGCKKEFLYADLRNTLYPVFARTINSGFEFGETRFVYLGIMVRGGETTHIHNFMMGLQNLFEAVDSDGCWCHRALVKFTERDATIAYWHRYAVRALIAYSKSVQSLYIPGINDLTIDELRIAYSTLCRVCWEHDDFIAKKA